MKIEKKDIDFLSFQKWPLLTMKKKIEKYLFKFYLFCKSQ